MSTWEMQTPKEGCRAEGSRKVSIGFASFTGIRNIILRKSHCLGAQQVLMQVLALYNLLLRSWS